MTQPATVGSQLLYTYAAADHCKETAVGQSRPATVVRDWGGCYNVQVLTDGKNDFADGRAVLHKTSIQLSECIGKGRLHWPGSGVDAPEQAPCEPEGEASPEPALADSAPDAVAPVEPEHIQTTVAPPTVLKKKAAKKSKPAKK